MPVTDSVPATKRACVENSNEIKANTNVAAPVAQTVRAPASVEKLTSATSISTVSASGVDAVPASSSTLSRLRAAVAAAAAAAKS